MVVETWRPIMDNTEMRRYFIGGTPELEDLSFCGGSNALVNNSNVLSRYGFRTMTSGKIRTRMYIMHQSKALMPSTSSSGNEILQSVRLRHIEFSVNMNGFEL